MEYTGENVSIQLWKGLSSDVPADELCPSVTPLVAIAFFISAASSSSLDFAVAELMVGWLPDEGVCEGDVVLGCGESGPATDEV